jgi:hypothetical protein
MSIRTLRLVVGGALLAAMALTPLGCGGDPEQREVFDELERVQEEQMQDPRIQEMVEREQQRQREMRE